MRTKGWLRGGLVALACLLATPAVADIKSFNAAIVAKDYKKAAAEAAATWPTLDKSRPDLAIIAREFGFAAYLAGDFTAARTFGEAAVAASRANNEEPVLQTGSELLWRLAEHRINPRTDTRKLLFSLLETRATQPDIDLVSFLSADAVTAYDFDKGLWRDAVASAALGDKLTADKPGYLETNFRFALVGAAANYMAERNMAAHEKIDALEKRLVAAIAAAPKNMDLTELEEVYRETSAWGNSTRAHLEALRRFRNEKAHDAEWDAFHETPEYRAAMARITTPLPKGVCPVRVSKDSRIPKYPSSIQFKGMIGTIILKMDVDETGKAYNPRLVAAVPAKHFADAALAGAAKMTFEPVEGASAGCTLAQKDKVVTFSFEMP